MKESRVEGEKREKRARVRMYYMFQSKPNRQIAGDPWAELFVGEHWGFVWVHDASHRSGIVEGTWGVGIPFITTSAGGEQKKPDGDKAVVYLPRQGS